eukprot:CAMPEP_0114567588 /NCGR_PEP_ID=MMETSP0114-20121206/15564_1 /TAXON_ID=31324 /ORGANISM="Goniomonas sp, Strain m" /LENGTH=309 /DNA_ID=CAMNT_0001754193 /DNA_START=14 /DNA_END=943 /DNA_ORIENTATION=+
MSTPKNYGKKLGQTDRPAATGRRLSASHFPMIKETIPVKPATVEAPVASEDTSDARAEITAQLKAHLSELPSRLEALSKFEVTEHTNIKKLQEGLHGLYELDKLIKEQNLLFQGNPRPSVASADPTVLHHDAPTLHELLVLWKSLQFTLPFQLERLQRMVDAGHLDHLDVCQARSLVEESNIEKIDSMCEIAENTMSRLNLLANTTFAMLSFKRQARRARERVAAQNGLSALSISADNSPETFTVSPDFRKMAEEAGKPRNIRQAIAPDPPKLSGGKTAERLAKREGFGKAPPAKPPMRRSLSDVSGLI